MYDLPHLYRTRLVPYRTNVPAFYVGLFYNSKDNQFFVQLSKYPTEFIPQPISRTEVITKQFGLPVLKIGYHLVTTCSHFTKNYCTRTMTKSLNLRLVRTAVKILQELLE